MGGGGGGGVIDKGEGDALPWLLLSYFKDMHGIAVSSSHCVLWRWYSRIKY